MPFFTQNGDTNNISEIFQDHTSQNETYFTEIRFKREFNKKDLDDSLKQVRSELFKLRIVSRKAECNSSTTTAGARPEEH